MDTIVSSEAYANAVDLPLNNSITAAGYKYVNARNKSFASELNAQTGVQGITSISLNFTKMMQNGVGKNGKMSAHVEMIVTITNLEGKTVFSDMYTATSEEKIAVAAGIYDPEKLMAQFPALIDTVTEEYLMEF
jgi:hypothetical protein